jgi:ribose transport system permease protein
MSVAAEPQSVAAPQAPTRQPAWRRALNQSPVWMGGVLLVLIVVFSILEPEAFPTTDNARNVLMDAAVLMVMAVGMTFVMVAGGFDLSIGSVLVFSGVIGVKAMEAMGTDNALTVIVGLLASCIAGLAWGVFNGLCITRLRVPALITTLGSLGAALGIARLITHGNDVRGVPLTLINVSTGTFLTLSWIIWVAAIVTLIGGLVLGLTRFGRHTYIIGSNAEAARRAGINVDRVKITCFMLCSTLAAVGGVLLASRTNSVNPNTGGSDVLLFAVGAAVIGGTSLFGGKGRVLDGLLGASVIIMIVNGMTLEGQSQGRVYMITGLVLLLAASVDAISRRRAAATGRV